MSAYQHKANAPSARPRYCGFNHMAVSISSLARLNHSANYDSNAQKEATLTCSYLAAGKAEL